MKVGVSSPASASKEGAWPLAFAVLSARDRAVKTTAPTIRRQSNVTVKIKRLFFMGILSFRVPANVFWSWHRIIYIIAERNKKSKSFLDFLVRILI